MPNAPHSRISALSCLCSKALAALALGILIVGFLLPPVLQHALDEGVSQRRGLCHIPMIYVTCESTYLKEVTYHMCT